MYREVPTINNDDNDDNVDDVNDETGILIETPINNKPVTNAPLFTTRVLIKVRYLSSDLLYENLLLIKSVFTYIYTRKFVQSNCHIYMR